MNTQHTPTPWYYDAETKTIRAKSREAFDKSTQMGDYRGCIVADLSEAIGEREHAIPEAEANAAFIVRAVNSHDALLEVLDAALTWWHSDVRRIQVKEPAWLESARAAIRKAKRE
jgi:hypothetical protein